MEEKNKKEDEKKEGKVEIEKRNLKKKEKKMRKLEK